jgi:acyl-CoA synthetase (AMP-forming)/AMP-acid ligase II
VALSLDNRQSGRYRRPRAGDPGTETVHEYSPAARTFAAEASRERPVIGLLEQHAQDNPEAIAIVDGSLRRTWRHWNERATKLANALTKRGVGRGSRVAVHARNRAEWLDTSFALSKIGANVVSVNPRLAVPEIRYIVDNSGATVLVSDQRLLPALHFSL